MDLYLSLENPQHFANPLNYEHQLNGINDFCDFKMLEEMSKSCHRDWEETN